MKKLLRNKKGFTLIELIVVILILAILAAILVPSILNYVGKAGESKDQANARSLYSEISIEVASLESGDSFSLASGTPIATKISNAKCNVYESVTAAGTSESTALSSIGANDGFVVRCGDFTFDGSQMATH